MSAPWTRGNLRIPKSVLEVVEDAARQAYKRDEESCGYLEGPLEEGTRIDRAVVMENLANKYHAVDPVGHPRTGREYFKIHTLQFERALSEARSQDRAVKVFFHSHLDCGAYFSKEDAASMTMGDGTGPTYELAYLVTAIDLGLVSKHRLFIWDETSRSFVESPFSVES